MSEVNDERHYRTLYSKRAVTNGANSHFYRAMLCVSAVYAVVLCPSVRPSVCPSRWCIISTQLKISSNFFFGPGSPIILVFDL